MAMKLTTSENPHRTEAFLGARLTDVSAKSALDPSKTTFLSAGDFATATDKYSSFPVLGQGDPTRIVNAVGIARGAGSAQVVSLSYAVAASSATTLAEQSACFAAEGILKGLSASLLRILADDGDSSALRNELRLHDIAPRVTRLLAAGELQNRSEARQDQKWTFERWLQIIAMVSGWIFGILTLLMAFATKH